MHIAITRIYDESSPDDGTRVLIDRLWPRGLSKDDAEIDVWAQDLAPSNELRKWYDHDSAKRSAFVEKYRRELERNEDAAENLLSRVDRRRRLTLLTATKDLDRSHAPVLGEFFEGR